jgi:uncharacterized membrane protein
VRLSAGQGYKLQEPSPSAQNVTVKSLVQPTAVAVILQTRCAQCHSELLQQSNSLLTMDNWLAKQDGKTKIEIKIFEDTNRPMPPDGSLTTDEKKLLKEWFLSI